MANRFNSARNFRMSLETRLKQMAEKENLDLQRIRRQLAFDRFLARIFFVHPQQFFLKGGYAMELIFSNARTTRDIDLVTIKHENENLVDAHIHYLLRDTMEVDLDDFFVFKISEPKKNLENPIYGGVRFLVDALVDNRRFVNFRIDVVADVFFGDLRKIQTNDWLDFSDILPSTINVISLEQQLAEKIHAYSLPPVELNSRVKDLIDLIMIVQQGDVNISQANKDLKRVFALRKTHPIPNELHPPPNGWILSYEKLKMICGITETLEEGFEKVHAFYQILARNEKSLSKK